VRATLAFAVSTALVVLGAGAVLGLVFTTPAERRAIWVSAGVAAVVQLFAFAVVRLAARDNVIAGWGIGALARMVVLGLYAFVIVGALGLAPDAALISLATFFFLTTLIEPLLLKV
jgi:hypothetical protein